MADRKAAVMRGSERRPKPSSIPKLTGHRPERKKEMKNFRIRGTWYTVKATCLKQALLKLVDSDGDFTYRPHWYTRSNRKSWAEFETGYGYRGVVEEV